MRGEDNKQDAIFSYVSPERRVSAVIHCERCER